MNQIGPPSGPLPDGRGSPSTEPPCVSIRTSVLQYIASCLLPDGRGSVSRAARRPRTAPVREQARDQLTAGRLFSEQPLAVREQPATLAISPPEAHVRV